ncbi:PREDICTED: protein FAR1-RELATED SEQUENCE 8 [Theobroma cacao]|uniref:Protein FAR1-RELATED SEQUENCE 8 n=1 Tax=Theobroma cacao TaxID=3641 RepID=A0AB32WY45_THECC|nr:PREDICTED: protein FAR1-RELATED SEQUENCE 8 [Theobroma cacao]
MAADSTISPSDHQALSPVLIEEGSQNSEQLFKDDGNELEIEGNDLEIEGRDIDIESNGLEIEGNGLDIESNGLQDCVQMLEIEDNHEIDGNDTTSVVVENDISQGKDYPPPAVGMEFESYDDAYNYYNCYAKELGVAIWVKSAMLSISKKLCSCTMHLMNYFCAGCLFVLASAGFCADSLPTYTWFSSNGVVGSKRMSCIFQLLPF